MRKLPEYVDDLVEGYIKKNKLLRAEEIIIAHKQLGYDMSHLESMFHTYAVEYKYTPHLLK